MPFSINDDETIEDLQLNGLQLIQKKNAFRFGMDSVLLAHFAAIHPNEIVADFGTGNGILIFLLFGRNKGKSYYALDIQSEAVELVRRNAELNGMQGKSNGKESECRDHGAPHQGSFFGPERERKTVYGISGCPDAFSDGLSSKESPRTQTFSAGLSLC